MSAVMMFLEFLIFVGVLLAFINMLNYLMVVAQRAMRIPMPTPKVDAFTKEYGYSFSYVFVFQVYDEDENDSISQQQRSMSLKVIVDRLTTAKFDIKCFYSAQKDEAYVKIRMEPKTLLDEANRINYKLEIDPIRLRNRLQSGRRIGDKQLWAPIILTDTKKQSKFKPYDHIFGEYSQKPALQSLYKQYGAGQILRGIDRIKLMLSMFQSSPTDNPPGCGLDMNELTTHKCLLANFSLHDYEELKLLQNEWLKGVAWPSEQPFTEIRNYFGETLGMYFLYLGHYTSELGLPSILGIATYIQKMLADGKPEALLMPIFSGFMIVWTTYFIESWKRREKEYAMRWGVVDFEKTEQERPQFHGKKTPSLIDGKEVKFFPPAEKTRVTRVANGVILVSIMTVIAVVVMIFILKLFLNRPDMLKLLTFVGIATGPIIASIIQAVAIIVLNATYSGIAFKLNEYENHRTLTLFEDALIVKIFQFQLVNSFAALFYTAFIHESVGGQCAGNNCTGEVAGMLSTIFITRLITSTLTKVVLPKLNQSARVKKESEGLFPGAKVTPIERQFTLEKYDMTRNLIADYSELVLQYGYVVLFVASFPLAPLFACVSCYCEIRIGGWRLCQIFMRPDPKTSEDIGSWEGMLEVVSAIAVFTNIAMIVFTGDYLLHVSNADRWVIFIFAEHFIFAVKYVIAAVIPDVPLAVEMQLQRQDFLCRKVINDEEDVEEQNFDMTDSSNNLIISATDGDWFKDGEEEEIAKKLNEATIGGESEKLNLESSTKSVEGIEMLSSKGDESKTGNAQWELEDDITVK